MAFKDCVKSVLKLEDDDAIAVIDAYDAYLAAGYTESVSIDSAIGDVLASAEQDKADYLELIGEQHPAKKAAPTKLGVNYSGFPVYEDGNGVRSYVESGIRISQSVGIIPGGGIEVADVDTLYIRAQHDFLTEQEWKDRLPKQKAPEEFTVDPSTIVSPVDPDLTQGEKALELRKLGEENQPIVQAIIDRIDAKYGTESKVNYKTLQHIVEKANRPSIKANKPWYDVEHVRDSFRFKTVLNSFDDLPGIVEDLTKEGLVIIKADVNKTLDPLEWGWRVVAFDLHMPNGQIVEYYLPVQELETAKHEGGHQLFEKWRNEKLAELTLVQVEAYQNDLAASKTLYNDAWNKFIERTGQPDTAIRASLMKAAAFEASSTDLNSLYRSSGEKISPSDQLPPTREKKRSPSKTETLPSSETDTIDLAAIDKTSEEIIAETEAAENKKLSTKAAEESTIGLEEQNVISPTTDDQKPDTRAEPERGEAAGAVGLDAEVTGRVRGTDAGAGTSGRKAGKTGKQGRAQRGGRAKTAVSRKGRGRGGAVTDHGRAAVPVQYTNYRITESDNLGKGSALVKARANIAAIRIVKQLEAENRPATKAEQAELIKYVGWGDTAIKNKLFPAKGEPTGTWKELHDELREILTKEELETAQRSVQYAHYTSKPIIDAIYSAIKGFGLKSGLAIEGGSGTGHFVGLMPETMNVHYAGVEMDVISAAIGRALYPESGMITGDFTRIGLPQNHYDLSIGNPPFANIVIKNDPKYRGNKFLLHDYFIAKQIDAVKPGGIAVFVTSKGTMNKVDDVARSYLADRANLLGAVRLPQTAFKETAGTEVVTDILFFQKKGEGVEDNGVAWADSVPVKIDEGTANINEYFVSHPEMILGKQALTGSMYRSDEYTVESTGDITEQLAEAINKLPQEIYTDNLTEQMLEAKRNEFEIAPEDKEASYYVSKDGVLRQVNDGVGGIVPVRGGPNRNGNRGKTAAQDQIVRSYIGLRDSVMRTYAAMASESGIAKAQREMVREYNKFVKAHGPLNQVKVTTRKDGLEIFSEPVIAAIYMDPEAFRVAGIEVFDEDTGKATKGDIFRENVIARFTQPQIQNAIDALNVTLNDRGYVDIEYLAEQYGQNIEDTLAELGNAVFKDPATGRHITEDEYLSSNVKTKLVEATEAAESDPTYKRNIDALEAVQPEDKDIASIPTNMGNHWMEPWVMESFAEKVLGFAGKITHFIQGDTSRWIVTGRISSSEHSTLRREATDILTSALNSATIKVYDSVSDGHGGSTQVLNKEETTAANQKAQEIKNKFKDWAKADPEAAEYIHRVYNEQFNTSVPRNYNGAHLTLPGLSNKFQTKYIDGVKKLGIHPWVRDVVWRIIQRGNTYMAHAVGAGKTLASITAAMEMRRLGIAKKPTFAVLKSTLKQFSAEFYEAYPNAKILIADEKQLDKKNRRRFMARMANEEFDAIIMTHEAFEKIELSPEFVTQMVESDLDEYRTLLEEVDEDDRATRSQIERMIEKMENKLVSQSAQDRKDAGLMFEELGIDFVFVDEAHNHKKIPFPTTQSNIKGVDAQGSNRAYDLYLKTRYMNTVRPGRNIVLMSGTPVTNTLGEVFNIQRYLQPQVLAAKSISSFDAWASTFTDSVTAIEMQPNGKYKPVTRLARFVGVPGLLRDFLQVADVVSSADMSQSLTIKRPSVKGGGRQIKVVPRGEGLKSYQKELDERIKALENKTGPPQRGEDNILVVITDGKKSAIDLRLVGRRNDVKSKLDVMIDDVFDFWQRSKDDVFMQNGKPELKKGASQLIFTEIRQAAGFDIYDHIKTQLIKMGVPEREIAFIQDFNTTEKKKRLFKDMNNGTKRILLGGSKNLGTGTNVQQRLGRINHLDLDYVPANIIQREGRGIRQGNKNTVIEIDAYATEGTVDSTMWGMNERKQGMIDQIMSGDLSVDSIEDISNEANQMAMAKALSSGNPLLLEQAGVQADVDRLQTVKNAFLNKRLRVAGELKSVRGEIASAVERLPKLAEYAKKYIPTAGDKFAATINNRKFTERKAAGEALIAHIDKIFKAVKEGRDIVKVANVGGFDVMLESSFGMRDLFILAEEGVNTSFMSDANGRHLYSSRTRVESVQDEEISAVGLIRQIENNARGLSELVEPMRESIEVAQKRLADLENQTTAEFQYEEELAQGEARLEEIDRQLEAEGDDTIPAAEPAEVSLDAVQQADDGTWNVLTPAGIPYAGTPAEGFETEAEAVQWAEQPIPPEDPVLFARTRKPGKRKGVTAETAQTVIDSFKSGLKGNPAGIRYIFRATEADAFGKQAAAEMHAEKRGSVKGAYYPKAGTILLIGENLVNGADVLETMRHETLAHFGLNLFNPEQKQQVLDKIKGSRANKNKAMRDLWARIDRTYSDKSEDMRAEEVLAAVAESKQLQLQKWWNDLLVLIRKFLKQIGLIDDVVGKPELQALVNTLADAIRTGKAQRTFPDAVMLQAAYHGSPHKFDKFSMENIGTGEGAQAYGHGLYFAENPKVAKEYSRLAVGQPVYDGKISAEAYDTITQVWRQSDFTEPAKMSPALMREWLDGIAEDTYYYRNETSGVDDPLVNEILALDPEKFRMSKPRIYEVDIPDEHVNNFLDWDKPLSYQPEHVQKAMAEAYRLSENTDYTPTKYDVGGELYGGLRIDDAKGSSKEVSDLLNSVGIKGLKYYDQMSRPGDVVEKRIQDMLDKHGGDVNAAHAEFMRTVHNTPKEKERISRDIRSKMERPSTRNLVVFDDSIVTILKRNGEPVDYQAEVKAEMHKQQAFDPNDPNILMRRDEEPIGGKLGMPEETYVGGFVRLFQNAFNRMGQLQEQIEDQGGYIPFESDVYLAEELSSGKTTARLRELDQQHMKPLIAYMDKEGITLEELDDFMRAKHAPERNDYIASINEDMQDGGSGMTYMEADAIMERLADKGEVLNFAADRVYAVNDLHVQTLVDAGHIEQETAEEWRQRWNYYVPLKGKVGEEETGRGKGTGYSVRGSGVKAAMGRGEGNMSESPTAHAFAQLENAIVRAEKTKIGQALVNLVRENPDPNFWTISRRTLKRFTDLYGEPFEGYDEAPEGMVEGIDFHRVKHVSAAEREAAKAENRKPVAKVAYRLDPAYRNRDDVFAVMLEGREVLINIKDPIVAEQLKRLNASQFNWLVRNAGMVNRYLAMMSTALNPEFVITNFERDLQTAMIHLTGEQTTEMAWKVFKSIPAAGRGIWQSTFDTKGDSPWRAEYDEMQREGGTIGFFGLEDIDTKIRHIQSRLDRGHSAFGKGQKAVFGLRDVVLDANLAVENSARLAAYVAARDAWIANGMPAKEARARAASLAKNLTVNFNRKGELGPLMNAFYLFYNASIQGPARIIASLAKSKRTRQIVGGIMVVGFLQAMFNRNFGGDDEDEIPKWDKISDYTKQTHMIFMIDGMERPVKFKMPYGYNVFHYTGTALHDLIFDDKKTAMGTTMSMLSAVLNSWNPLQGADLLDTLVPTVAKPFEQSERNINFMGAPIKPEYPFDGYDRPESQKYWKSTSAQLKEFTRILNEATGGDETHPGAIDVSPETINHYIKWLFGGAGATASRAASTTTNLLTGEPIDVRNVPFARSLVVPESSYYDRERFYESAKQVAAVEAQLKLYKGTDRYADYRAENYEVHKLAFHVPKYKRRIKKLNEKRDKAYADKDTELANDIREQIRQQMMEFSRRYDDAIEAQR